MDKTLTIPQAIRFVFLAVAMFIFITIWPLRLWQREVTLAAPSFALSEGSANVNDESDAAQKFIAAFDRLGAVDLYFYPFTHGRYISFAILNDSYDTIYSAYVDMAGEDLPGMVRIPVDVPLTPGKEYMILLLGCYSTFDVGVESTLATDFADDRNLRDFYVHDTVISDQTMRMDFVYTPPLSRNQSLLRMLLIAAVSAFVFAGSFALQKGRSGKPYACIPVSKLLRVTLIPATAVFFFVLLLFTLTGRFNDRLTENAFLAFGLLLSCALLILLILVLTQKNEGHAKPVLPAKDRILRALLVVTIAALMMFSCEYMNGLFDVDHKIAERKEGIAFSLLIVLMYLRGMRADRGKRGVRLTAFGILTILLFVLLFLFRNGRLWGVALIVFFVLFYLAYARGRDDTGWTRILSGGLTLHFAASVVYCMLFRVFAGFVSARYGFVFHTVTVTAEYLTMMCGVACAWMIRDIRSGKRFRWYPSFLMFGTVAAYAVLTMSRTAYLSIAVMCILMLFLCAVKRGGAAKLLLLMVSALLLLFPAVFSLQRVVPAMVNRARVFAVEDTSSFLLGHAAWDHPHYMTLERFHAMFVEKILNGKSKSYLHPIDRYNYDEDANPLYGPNGIPIDEYVPEREETLFTTSGFDIEQFSNGRLTIWRAYLEETNLTGHEDMGVLLPGGEVAVHAHNTYLQAAHDHGLITGVVFALWTATGICFGMIYYKKRGTVAGVSALPLALTVGFACAALTEWVFLFSNPMTLGVMFAIAPLMMRFPAKRERGGHPIRHGKRAG